MGLFKGGALRLFQTFLYALAFCCAAVILGIYSYFLSVLADRNQGVRAHQSPLTQRSATLTQIDQISNWKRAVEGLSGVAVLYLIFAVLLTCCFGGVSVLAFIAIVLDLCFVAAMIAIAVMTRHGASSCHGYVRTPLGNGNANSATGGFGQGGFGEGGQNSNSNVTYSVHLGTACRLNSAAFAVSLIAAFIFLCTAALQVALVRHHKKEKRYGPGPSNNYTSGYGKRRGMFERKNKNANNDAELGSVGAGVPASSLATDQPDIRPSHETGYTGSTVAAPAAGTYDKVDGTNNHTHQGHLPHGTHGGYYTQPQGTGVNPYGYDNTPATNQYSTGTATNY